MIMKQTLRCTLIFMVLVTSGCGSDEPSRPKTNSPTNSNSPPTLQQRNTINFTGAENDVREAIKGLNSSGRSGSSPIVRTVKSEINKAIEKLGTDNAGVATRCADCDEETITGAAEIVKNLNGLVAHLGTDNTPVTQLDTRLKTEVQKGLDNEADKLKTLSTAQPKNSKEPSPGASQTTPEPKTNIDDQNNSWIWDKLILLLQGIGGLLALVLLGSTVNYLWNRSWKTLESNVGQLVKAHVAAARDGQPDYTPKLSSLASTQADINSKLSELDTEVRSLARLLRDSLGRRPDRNPSSGASTYQSYAEDVSPKDEPEFPVSAVDYLGKMNRFANVVRPDFQNGILVNAPDGDGELVLIRDSRDDTQPLFVIPRATQFHTKQDFYTYYQKYYDCVRPTAGDVWIIGPAVVEKVTGGWQLREKGMLEVR